MAVHSAPDCDTTEMPPTAGMWLAKEAFILWWVLMRPRQLGPISRAPEERHRSAISFSRRAPSSSTSLKPAVITTTALAPWCSEEITAPLTAAVGTAMTLRSMGLPVLLEAGVDLVPEHLAPARVDRDDVPFESPLDEVGYDGVADFPRCARCPHHRDRLGIEQRLKHGNLPCPLGVLSTVAAAARDDTTSLPAGTASRWRPPAGTRLQWPTCETR